MFIVVKYGERIKEILNPDCSVFHLLIKIREVGGRRPDEVVDLTDESGHLKHLPDHDSLVENAKQFFRDREVCIMLKVAGHKGRKDSLIARSTTLSPQILQVYRPLFGQEANLDIKEVENLMSGDKFKRPATAAVDHHRPPLWKRRKSVAKPMRPMTS